MRERIAIALSVLVVAAVPAVLIGNTLWLLMGSWLVDAEYALPGFPADAEGLDAGERKQLADTGIEAIRPFGGGVELLRAARLPDAEPAFSEREISHMQDVRDLVAGVLSVWAIALALAVAALLALRGRGEPGAAAGALVRGGWLTLGAMALIGVVMLIDFEFFFDGFHGVFFEGDSWRFNDAYTLRRIYPDFFWGAAGGTMAALIAAQAGALILCLRARS
jgi:integral membrane protein (TIGR01906 family)